MSKEEILHFPAGSAIMFTSGEYSDFGIVATLITIKPLYLPEAAKNFSKNGNGPFQYIDYDKFAAFLITEGYCMAADVQSVHLGDYGEFTKELIGEDAKP